MMPANNQSLINKEVKSNEDEARINLLSRRLRVI